MKLRASFHVVLTNFPPTTENTSEAMWSQIKSPIWNIFVKAPCTASAVWKVLVGFDIHAEFLFVHIAMGRSYMPDFLLAENRAAPLK